MKRLFIILLMCITFISGSIGCSDTASGSTSVSDNASTETGIASGSDVGTSASMNGSLTSASSDAVSDNAVHSDSSSVEDAGTQTDEAASVPEPIEYTISGNQIIKFSSFDLNDTYEESTASSIRMNDMEVTVTGSGIIVEDNRIVITEGGTYLLEGSLSNGQIYVRVGDQDKVHLIFNNINIFCNTSAPVYIDNADKTVITLPEGTVNTITDSLSPIDDSANGCIYSKDDLTINGAGTLNVTGNFNNAISCKNDLKIVNGTYNITAANNGLKGNDSIAILNCTMNIESLDDGCKVSNDTEADKGYLFIAGGSIDITTNDDCFQSTCAFVIQGGHVLARCYGKIVNCDGWQIGTEEYIEEWM